MTGKPDPLVPILIFIHGQSYFSERETHTSETAWLCARRPMKPTINETLFPGWSISLDCGLFETSFNINNINLITYIHTCILYINTSTY